jgi:putative ABC transport system permease protein
MFKNYLKIAFRNIIKHKEYSLVSTAGLAVGMAVFIITAFFVHYEFNFDTFHENYDRVYRVEEFYQSNRAYGNYPITPPPLAPALVQNYPEIVAFTRIGGIGKKVLYIPESNKKFHENEGLLADNPIFDVFTFPLMKGDPKTALVEPYSLVLNEELAKKYFPHEEPLGKTIKVQDFPDCKVTGVVKNVPKNSHMQFSYLLSLSSLGSKFLENCDEDAVYSYLLMGKKHSPQDLERKINGFLLEHRTGDMKNDKVELYLKPLSQVHHSNTNYELESALPREIVYMIFTIGLMILLISCINFVNLSTAYSSVRGKEVGVRKVVGAARFSLIKQFLTESILLSLISFSIALVLVEISLPEFNLLLNTNVEINLLVHWKFITGLIFITFLVGILSGSYLRNMDKGFEEENILVRDFDDPGRESIEKYRVLKEELLKNLDILSTTVSTHLPFAIYNDMKVNWEGGKTGEDIWITYAYVDVGFIDTYGIKLKEGRNFSKKFSMDQEDACIINEKALQMFGWDSPAVGKRIGNNKYRVIGVVKDFCSSDMRLGIKPVMLLPYAMASFTTRRRTKEIGIRKVVGASVSKVLLLLFKEFIKLLTIANLIAWPAAFLLMTNLLQNFAFRIEIQLWIFLAAGVTVFIVAAAAVSYQTIKVAFTNPVNALRYE